MTGVAQRQVAQFHRTVRRHGGGEKIVLRRAHGLRTSRGGVPEVLEVATAGDLGDELVEVRADGLRGEVPAGLPLVVGGEVYLVQAQAEVSGGSVAVSILPGLAAPAAAGEAVLLEQSYADAEYFCAFEQVSQDEALQGDRTRKVNLSGHGAIRAPRAQDSSPEFGSVITPVVTVGTTSQPAGWIVALEG